MIARRTDGPLNFLYSVVRCLHKEITLQIRGLNSHASDKLCQHKTKSHRREVPRLKPEYGRMQLKIDDSVPEVY